MGETTDAAYEGKGRDNNNLILSFLPPSPSLPLPPSPQDYIARFGRGSNAKQAQSKEKVLSKMVAGGLTEKVAIDKVVSFSFPDCGSLPPPVIMVQRVSFRYGPDKVSLRTHGT